VVANKNFAQCTVCEQQFPLDSLPQTEAEAVPEPN